MRSTAASPGRGRKAASGPSLTTAIDASLKPKAAAICRRASFDTVTIRFARRIASCDFNCHSNRERQFRKQQPWVLDIGGIVDRQHGGCSAQQWHERVASWKQYDIEPRFGEGTAHSPHVL